LTDIVVVGAGGHAREVVEILRDTAAAGSDHHPIGYVDDDPTKQGAVLDGLPVLGGMKWLEESERAEIKVICAIGQPELCEELAQRVKGMGRRFGQAISPRALVSPNATLGEGVIIFPNVVVNTGAKIGNCVTLNVGTTVSHDSIVGDYSNVNPGVHLAGNVEVGRKAYVGMGANIIQGLSVGEHSVIGAGAVVISDVAADTRAVGVPAQASPKTF
jgi:sugar O-acyltransferase (sialic acid O-acetyltransferase NeuD family)